MEVVEGRVKVVLGAKNGGDGWRAGAVLCGAVRCSKVPSLGTYSYIFVRC